MKEILTINQTLCELFFNIKMKCEEIGIYAVTCEIIDISAIITKWIYKYCVNNNMYKEDVNSNFPLKKALWVVIIFSKLILNQSKKE